MITSPARPTSYLTRPTSPDQAHSDRSQSSYKAGKFFGISYSYGDPYGMSQAYTSYIDRCNYSESLLASSSIPASGTNGPRSQQDGDYSAISDGANCGHGYNPSDDQYGSVSPGVSSSGCHGYRPLSPSYSPGSARYQPTRPDSGAANHYGYSSSSRVGEPNLLGVNSYSSASYGPLSPSYSPVSPNYWPTPSVNRTDGSIPDQHLAPQVQAMGATRSPVRSSSVDGGEPHPQDNTDEHLLEEDPEVQAQDENQGEQPMAKNPTTHQASKKKKPRQRTQVGLRTRYVYQYKSP